MTTGVGNAFLDRVPLFAFTAQMGKFWKGRTVQMQIDHQKLYAPITKWTAELKTGQIYGIMKKATEIALAEQPDRFIWISRKTWPRSFPEKTRRLFSLYPPPCRLTTRGS